MGVVLRGFQDLIGNLRNTAERSSRGSREALAQGAEDIKDLAVLYAPVDEGNLEDSIKVGKFRGHRGRNVYTVFVDESTSAGNGRTVGDYAMRMHDDYSYHLGPLSQAKADETGLPVGAGFLERAFEDLEESIKVKVESKTSQGIGH